MSVACKVKRNFGREKTAVQKNFIVSEEMGTLQEKNSEVAIFQLLANLLKIYMQMFWWKRFRLHWFWVWNLQNIWHRTGAHLDNKTRWDNVDIQLPTFSFQNSEDAY